MSSKHIPKPVPTSVTQRILRKPSPPITGVLKFDWASVEVLTDKARKFFMVLLFDDHEIIKNFRKFGWYSFRRMANGWNENYHAFLWTDKSGEVLRVAGEGSFYIMLKRFVQQGGNPPYHKIELRCEEKAKL